MSKRLTDEEIQQALKLCKQATPGPWGVEGNPNEADVFCLDGDELVATRLYPHDAHFLCLARAVLPRALKELRVLRSRTALLNLPMGIEEDQTVIDLVQRMTSGEKKAVRCGATHKDYPELSCYLLCDHDGAHQACSHERSLTWADSF